MRNPDFLIYILDHIFYRTNNLIGTSYKEKYYKFRNKRIKNIIKKFKNDLDPIYNNNNKTINDTKQNTIWVYWGQGKEQMPPIVKFCYQSIVNNSNGHEIVFLTNKNFFNYVKIAPYLVRMFYNHQISYPCFSDIIRVNLLSQKGGLWLDSTIFLNRPISEDFFSHQFYSIKTREFGNFVSKCRWTGFVMGGQRGSKIFVLLSKLYELYFSKYNKLIDYLLLDHFINFLYDSYPDIKKYIDMVPLNNPYVHALSSILDQNFNTKEWDNLTKETNMFKLSHKRYPVDYIFNSESYFHKINQ